MKTNLTFIILFLLSSFGYSQSTYWYQYGQQDVWHFQPDVYAFRTVGGQAYTGPLDPGIVEVFTYQEDRRDKANEICFKASSSLMDRQNFIREIEQNSDFEMSYPVVTKNPTSGFSEDSWFIVDDLVLVNFKQAMGQQELDAFMSDFNLDPLHTPSPSLPTGGNYTYVFKLDPSLYGEQDATEVSALLIELASEKVKEASPNFVNIRLSQSQMGNPDFEFNGLDSNAICGTDDPISIWSWYMDNPGGWTTSYIDPSGTPWASPPSVANADLSICECWDEGLSGDGITIGIVSDGAFDYTHPDIGNSGSGWDCRGICAPLDRVNAPMEVNASGTFLTSLVGARRNNATGIAGIAYNATMNAYRIDEASNTTSWAILIRTVQRAISDKVDVLMLGWMMSPGNSNLYTDLQNAITYGRVINGTPKGIILVATPGGGINLSLSGTSFPAAYPQVLSVIGSNPKDQLCTVGDGWDYLNPSQPYGSVYGAQYDIAAPVNAILGHDITSGYGWATSGVNTLGNDYTAAPSQDQPLSAPALAAGVAALLLDQQEGILWHDLHQIMRDGADQVGGYAYSSATGASSELGHGRLNCSNSMLLLDSPEERSPIFDLEVVNPLGSEMTLFSYHDHTLRLQLELYDLNGREIMVESVSLSPGKSSMPLPNMTAGMYFLTLTDKDGISFSKKLIRP